MSMAAMLDSFGRRFESVSKSTTFRVGAMSFVGLVALFYTVVHLDLIASLPRVDSMDDAEEEAKGRKATGKRKSWIITAVSSLVMTIGSLAFVLDLVSSYGDVSQVSRRETLASGLCAFFISYLLADIVLGLLHYREHVNIVTGWIHHTVYVALVYYLIALDISHVFALAAFMELPTFLLAINILIPRTRSDELFNLLFFLTRIVFHFGLILLYGSEHGRSLGGGLVDRLDDGTIVDRIHWVPVLSLIAASPLHINWFVTSMSGMMKRRRNAALASSFATAATATMSSVNKSSAASFPIPSLHASPPAARPTFIELATARLPHMPTIPVLPLLGMPIKLRPHFPPGTTEQRRHSIVSSLRSPFLASTASASVNGDPPLSASNSMPTIRTLEHNVRDYFLRLTEDRMMHFPAVPLSITQLVQSFSTVRIVVESGHSIAGDARRHGEGTEKAVDLNRGGGFRDQLLQVYFARNGPRAMISFDEMRHRAGEGGAELKRFGGRMRRRITGERGGNGNGNVPGLVDPL